MTSLSNFPETNNNAVIILYGPDYYIGEDHSYRKKRFDIELM
tara:strand:- start:338 stop:463 length:126 start_codon:yes stop_codon:yes gene_type:complete